MSLVHDLHRDADAQVDARLARNKEHPPCREKCFWCCRESVIASDEECSEIVANLLPEERDWIAGMTGRWLVKFRASGMSEKIEPSAVEDYRPLNLWCPLLRPNGSCACYEHRPLACRLHIAHETNEGCKDDSKRAEQEFVLFPGLIDDVSFKRIEQMKDGESIVNDHLCILLAKELLGVDEPTKARITFTSRGEELEIARHTEE